MPAGQTASPFTSHVMSSKQPALNRLTPTQRAALQNVVAVARSRQAVARRRAMAFVRHAECSEAMFDATMESIRCHARVILHFHPDRIGVRAITVAEAVLEDGQYRSQFETGLSSGSLTAFPGGPRDEWERSLFGGTYHNRGSTTGERPKYGALELIRYPDGPWPRFGSCYFVLRSEVSRRTSFTFSGSEQPDVSEHLGTIECLECVLAPLLSEVAGGAHANISWPPFSAPTLGVDGLTVSNLLERLSKELPLPRADPSCGPPGRVLDTGIEAQIHGPIDLGQDVERLVADSAFIGRPTGDCLKTLCQKYAIALEWHCGFQLLAEDVPDGFRGSAIPRLAQRIARDGVVDAAVIGAAQASLRLRPHEWREQGEPKEILQHLKQLWHVVVQYGTPVMSTAGTI